MNLMYYSPRRAKERSPVVAWWLCSEIVLIR